MKRLLNACGFRRGFDIQSMNVAVLAFFDCPIGFSSITTSAT
jgi:hypothetical protein